MAKPCWSHEPNPPKTNARSWVEKIIWDAGDTFAKEKERLVWEQLKNAHKDATYREPPLVPK